MASGATKIEAKRVSNFFQKKKGSPYGLRCIQNGGEKAALYGLGF